MLKIRLQRVGKRNNPAYRVILTDSRRAPKSGGFLEILGSYNPQHKDLLALKKEKISHWISKGAQVSDTVHNLLVRENVINAPKRNVVAPSKFKKAPVEEPKGDEKQPEAGESADAPPEEKSAQSEEPAPEKAPAAAENEANHTSSQDEEKPAEEKPAEA